MVGGFNGLSRSSSRVVGRGAGSALRYPACHVLLTGARDAERSRRHILVDNRPGRGVGTVAHADRRHEHVVRASADIAANRRVVFAHAVVDEDGCRPDVGVLADRGVADV